MTRRLLWTAGLVTLVVLTLDLLGLLRPAPSPQRLLSRMDASWVAVDSYRATVSIGAWGRMGSHPESATQYWFRGGPYLLSARDSFGFRHVERWDGNVRRYFQPGARFEATITYRGLGDEPLGRWRISESPSLEELVSVIRSASDARLVRHVTTEREPQWIVECRPRVPKLHGGSRRFYEKLLGQPWTVWLSDLTGLPVHISIGEETDEERIRIGVDGLETGGLSPPTDWRAIHGGETAVEQRLVWACDAWDEAAVARTTARVRQLLDAWRSGILNRAGPAGAQ